MSDDRPLRILAVGDARSIHTIRWARRLDERGNDGGLPLRPWWTP